MAVGARIGRLLIANRGEIAVRIARTCRAMNITSIAVYSDADRDAFHVRQCDEAVRIGPPPARESYLNIERVLDAARASSARAIHPGYGFLSENPEFAHACAAANIAFVGPPAAVMRAVGNKIEAKKTANGIGVPTVPGYLGEDQSDAALAREATRLGAPVMIKAAAGGGGKGMRLVRDLSEFAGALESARREASAAFCDGTVFLERFLSAPRHVEVQVLADQQGNCIHLNERECSIQRRHQKIVEETPSPAVSSRLRSHLGDAAIRIAQAVGYVNAGTVEFMLLESGEFYFLEVNARLQVEHPVTEEATGVDLVREQIEVAAGRLLHVRQEDVAPRAHAIEVRLYAEDPAREFLPSSGRILAWRLPSGPGVRLDSGVVAGSVVTSDYDPMLAKLIVSGRSREEALARLQSALDESLVAGVATNVEFLRWLAREPDFCEGKTATDFLERHRWPGAELRADSQRRAALAAAGALQELGAWRHGAQKRVIRFSASAPVEVDYDWREGAWRCRAGGCNALVRRKSADGNAFELVADGPEEPGLKPRHYKPRHYTGSAIPFAAWSAGDGVELALGKPAARVVLALDALEDVAHAAAHAHGQRTGSSATAPMSGTIVKVEAKSGDRVGAHQVIAVMEAMKMEHAVAAPYEGTLLAVNVKPGDRVQAGEIIAEIEPAT